MSLIEQIITIVVVVIGTMTTRFLPFVLFPTGKRTPESVRYLGAMLPAAALGLLVVYCFKDVARLPDTMVSAQLIASVAVVLLHIWKRQMLLSIAGGTVLYMIMVQLVFR